MFQIGQKQYLGSTKTDGFGVIPILVNKSIGHINTILHKDGGVLNQRLAFRHAELMREALLSGSYDPAPLEESWKKEKAFYGWDPRIGFMLGEMFNSIDTWRAGSGSTPGSLRGWTSGIRDTASGKIGSGSIMHSYVGGMPRARGVGNRCSRAPRPMYKIARWFNYRTETQLRRPFITYAYDKMLQQEMSKTLYDMYTAPFRRLWRSGELYWKESFRFI